ncbi:DUF763 domain-containing protein [Halostella sp. JP-L12]|nr:DUF763 domain-containing protein [Halostella sp. JP-L12]
MSPPPASPRASSRSRTNSRRRWSPDTVGRKAVPNFDAESSREDPAKYAYAHGGKDGTP